MWADPVLKGEYYQITNLSDLEWFRDQVNNGNGGIKAELKANITINENVLGTLKILSDGMNSNGEGLKRWTPIGKTDKLPFSGEFKGNNYTISGVYISAENSASTNVGLFGTNSIRSVAFSAFAILSRSAMLGFLLPFSSLLISA